MLPPMRLKSTALLRHAKRWPLLELIPCPKRSNFYDEEVGRWRCFGAVTPPAVKVGTSGKATIAMREEQFDVTDSSAWDAFVRASIYSTEVGAQSICRSRRPLE